MTFWSNPDMCRLLQSVSSQGTLNTGVSRLRHLLTTQPVGPLEELARAQQAADSGVLKYAHDATLLSLQMLPRWFTVDIPESLRTQWFRYVSALERSGWVPYSGNEESFKLVRAIGKIWQEADEDDWIDADSKEVDALMFDYFDSARIQSMVAKWTEESNNSVQAEKFREVAACVEQNLHIAVYCMLTPEWERIIRDKTEKEKVKDIKQLFNSLLEHNEADKAMQGIVYQFFCSVVYGTVRSGEEPPADFPNRNVTAHAIEKELPSRKSILNALLLTDFLFTLDPLSEEAATLW